MCNFEQPAFSCSHDCIECSATVYNVQRATCTSNILQWSFVSKIIENMAKTRCQVEYSMDASVSWRNPTIDICFIIHGENESSFPVATKFSTKQPVQANVSPFRIKFVQISLRSLLCPLFLWLEQVQFASVAKRRGNAILNAGHNPWSK